MWIMLDYIRVSYDKSGGVIERCGNVDHVKTTLGLVMIS